MSFLTCFELFFEDIKSRLSWRAAPRSLLLHSQPFPLSELVSSEIEYGIAQATPQWSISFMEYHADL